MRLSVMIVLFLFVAVGPSQASDRAVTITLLENSPDVVVMDYRFSDFSQGKVRIDDQEYVQIYLGRESLMLQNGSPSLPDVSRSIVVPLDAVVTTEVTYNRYYELEAIDIVPSRGSISRSVNPATVPYTFSHIYNQNSFFPGTLVSCREPYILRDVRGMVVTVNPFQYNPAQRTLRVYTALTIKVSFRYEQSGPAFHQAVSAKRIIRPFHELYQHHFLNYTPSTRYSPLDEEGEMLIVAHDPWLSELNTFAAHKIARGIPTTVVGVSTIGNNATAIKNYIQALYDSPEHDLAFVLLVGDAAQVAPPYASGGASDPSYAKLAGNDDYPDILVGRFSAESIGQLQTQLQRTIEYEQLPATGQTWFWKATGIGSAEGPGDDNEYDWEHIDNIRTDLLGHGYTTVDQIYDPGATAAQVTASLNAGRGLVNYCGHGGIQSWSTTGFDNNDVDNLTNDNMLPFIVSVACNNGEFDDYTCFGEAWLRATHGTEPTGAIGVYASSISQSWDEPMCAQDEIADRYCDETYSDLGTLFFAGSCQMMDEYGSDGVRIFNTWILFGDPSLQVVAMTGLKVSPGTAFKSSGPNGGPFSPDSITYTLTNLDQQFLSFQISKSATWYDLSQMSGTLAPGAQLPIVVTLNAEANSLANNVYQDQLQFINLSSHDGDTSRAVSLQIGVETTIYSFPLESDPGWTTSGEWQFGQPTGNGGASYGNPDPDSGYTGTKVYGINLNGDYSTAVGGPYYLTSTALDCSQIFNTKVRYRRWLNADYQPFVICTFEASNNGTDWTILWQNGGSEMLDDAWVAQEFNLSEIADGMPTVFLRWGHRVGSSAWAYSGWNIDDIEIVGIPTGNSPVPTLSGWAMILLTLLLGTVVLVSTRSRLLHMKHQD
ncbi:hypothetical protein JXQ70_18950 [bacterium]|nr:hypothetical protein [bacterium]